MKFTRSVSVDIFLKEESRKQYDRHLQKITQIKEHRANNNKIEKQTKKVTEKLHKAREQARSFKNKQEHKIRSLEQRKMRNYIDNIQPMLKLKEKQANRKQSNERKFQSRMRQFQIQMTNKKLLDSLKAQELDLAHYKHKIATEVSDYIKLREHIQRFKTINQDGRSEQYKIKNHDKVEKTERSERSEKTSVSGSKSKVVLNRYNSSSPTEPTATMKKKKKKQQLSARIIDYDDDLGSRYMNMKTDISEVGIGNLARFNNDN